MKPLLFLILALAGCAAAPSPVPAAKKEALRKFLAPAFAVAAIPASREIDFYATLEAFAKDRQADELVQRVEFALSGEITLFFSNSGMHGGGVAIFKQKDGRWVEDQKAYFM